MPRRAVCQVASSLRSLLVPCAGLSLDPANARLHGERSIEALKASLARFGQQKAIVVDAKGVVIAGNGTLEAARALGWTHIAAIRSDLAGIERTAYAIADNRIAELSTWDQDALRQLAGALPDDALDAAGFTKQDLASVLAGSGSRDVAEVETPAPPANPVSRLGDLWHLGEHRLLCGDCTDAAAVKGLMGGERATLFATDPPYLVDYDGTNHPQHFDLGRNRRNGSNKDWSGTYGTTWDDADANSDLHDRFIATAVQEAIHERAAWYCWHASRRQALLEAAWNKHGAFVHCQIVWVKNKPVLTRSWYLWQHEPCLMGWKKGCRPSREARDGRLSTVWSVDTLPNTEDRPDHPTPKPIELFAHPLLQHTKPRDLCYEPFSGSGTQIIAAEQLGRRCYAIDIQPAYIDVAITRWQTLTGKEATLGGTRRTFAQVAQERRRCRPSRTSPAGTQGALPSSPPATAPSTRPSKPARAKGPGARRSAPPRAGATARRGGRSGSRS